MNDKLSQLTKQTPRIKELLDNNIFQDPNQGQIHEQNQIQNTVFKNVKIHKLNPNQEQHLNHFQNVVQNQIQNQNWNQNQNQIPNKIQNQNINPSLIQKNQSQNQKPLKAQNQISLTESRQGQKNGKIAFI